MLIKITAAAVAAFAFIVPASAEAGHGDVVIRVDHVDASDPAAVQQLLGKFRQAASDSCQQTGSRIASHTCVADFVKQAINGVRRSDLRVALVAANGEAGDTADKVASLPAE